jgi:hypothetical protein
MALMYEKFNIKPPRLNDIVAEPDAVEELVGECVEDREEEESEETKQEREMYDTKYRFQLEDDDAEASLLLEYEAGEPSFIFPLPDDVPWKGKYTEKETREAKTAPADRHLHKDYSRECLYLDKPWISNSKPSRVPRPSKSIQNATTREYKSKLEIYEMISGGWWLPTNKAQDKDIESNPLCKHIFSFSATV